MSSDGLDWDALAGRKFGGSRATHARLDCEDVPVITTLQAGRSAQAVLGQIGGGVFEGVAVMPDRNALDGHVLVVNPEGRPWMLVGLRPYTRSEWCAEMGKRIARHGLAQWVAYIGEEVGPSPEQPVPLVSGAQLLDLIRSGAISPRGRRP